MAQDAETKLDPAYSIEYSFLSGVNYMEEARYCLDITGEISTYGEESSKRIQVGRITAHKLLLAQAVENDENPVYVFDRHQITMEIGEEVYDFKQSDWCKALERHYKDGLYSPNMLILARIEILPAFRGKNIGKRVIKDLYNNFIDGCALFALKCFPIQLEAGIRDSSDPFTQKMNYRKMEQDEGKCFNKLNSFYKNMGFETVPGIDREIMVINPAIENPRFNAISLD